MPRPLKQPKVKLPQVDLVAVQWMDTARYDSDMGIDRDSPLYPLPILSFGYLIEETDTYVKLSDELWADGRSRHVTAIAKIGMGGLVTFKAKVDLPSLFTLYPSDKSWLITE